MSTLNTSFKPTETDEEIVTQEEHDEHIENEIQNYQVGQVTHRVKELHNHIEDINSNIKSLNEVKADYQKELDKYCEKYPECFI